MRNSLWTLKIETPLVHLSNSWLGLIFFKDNFPCFSVLKGYNLPGLLPPQLVKLPYLREVYGLRTP